MADIKTGVRSFRIHILQAELDDLRICLAMTRWPVSFKK